MMTNTFLSDDALPEGKLLSTDTIELAAEQVDRAIAASHQGQTEQEQWHRYVQALAWEGVQEWFQKRAPQLTLQRQEGPALERFQVGDFRVYLVVTDSLDHREVALSEAAVQPLAHFYLLVEVLEDLEQVTVGGYLRGDQMRQSAIEHGFCWLDTTQVEASSDRLLLELQSLSPAAIALPDTAPDVVVRPNTPTLGQRVINAGLWLRDQLDPLAEELAWMLLPAPGLSPAIRGVRSPVEQFNDVMANLADQQGVQVPPQAKAAYKGLFGQEQDLYLYVVTWELEPWNTPSEWCLMAILSAPSGTPLPAQTDLQIWEGLEPLVEQRLEHSTDGGYLFAQVGGSQDEQFSIQIRLPGYDMVQLPPFGFDKRAEPS